MILTLIAAIGKKNELGKGNTLLFHMPADMKRFREVTSGHPVIMGRKTFESLGKPLPKRRNVVITRSDFNRDGIEVVHSLEEAIDLFKESEKEVFVIGGGEIYKQAIELADRLDITEVEATDPEADTFFPSISEEWKEVSRERHEVDEENKIPYSFVIYEKKSLQ